MTDSLRDQSEMVRAHRALVVAFDQHRWLDFGRYQQRLRDGGGVEFRCLRCGYIESEVTTPKRECLNCEIDMAPSYD